MRSITTSYHNYCGKEKPEYWTWISYASHTLPNKEIIAMNYEKSSKGEWRLYFQNFTVIIYIILLNVNRETRCTQYVPPYKN